MKRDTLNRRAAADIGLAIGADGLTAVVRRGGSDTVETVPLQIDPAAADLEARLATAMHTLSRRVEAAVGRPVRARVHVAILPPLAECRLLQLPPLRSAEAALVVQRDAGRWFMTVPAPRLTAVARPASPAAPVRASAAPASLLETLHRALAGVGWQVAGTAAAHGAWLAAEAGVKGTHAIVAVEDDTAHVLVLHDGVLTVLRRVPATAVADVVRAAGDEPGAASILAEAGLRTELGRHFRAAGWTLRAAAGTPAEVAARHARGARPQLVAASAELQRREVERRSAGWLAAATVVLLVGAALVQLWGAQRELDAVRGRRAEIRAQVAPLLSMRDSVQRLEERHGAIETLAAGAPRWTGAIFELTMLLPPETHLTRLHTTGDTIVVEAQGDRAGATLQALRSAGSLRDARLLGPVDRELADGATALERFRLSARLAGEPPRSPATFGGRSAAGGER
jgi:hypothetical protein